jgi:hypothetical protein
MSTTIRDSHSSVRNAISAARAAARRQRSLPAGPFGEIRLVRGSEDGSHRRIREPVSGPAPAHDPVLSRLSQPLTTV